MSCVAVKSFMLEMFIMSHVAESCHIAVITLRFSFNRKNNSYIKSHLCELLLVSVLGFHSNVKPSVKHKSVCINVSVLTHLLSFRNIWKAFMEASAGLSFKS